MPLHAPGAFEERILIYGGPSAGKTTMWMGIADLSLKTRSDAQFWVIDNDNATKRVIANPRGSFHHLEENTTIWTPRDFDEYEGITEKILNDAQPDDWIVVDMGSNVWEGLPDWWIKQVYGDSTWNYYASVRRDIENEEAGAGERNFGGQKGVDWQYIGKTYRAWEKQLTIHGPCHVLMTSSETEIQARFDKTGEQQARYGITNNMAPKMEKGAPHRFHTIIRASRVTSGQGRRKTYSYKMTAVKDRDRDEIWEEKGGRGLTVELSDGPRFGMDYLVKMAEWGLGKV